MRAIIRPGKLNAVDLQVQVNTKSIRLALKDRSSDVLTESTVQRPQPTPITPIQIRGEDNFNNRIAGTCHKIWVCGVMSMTGILYMWDVGSDVRKGSRRQRSPSRTAPQLGLPAGCRAAGPVSGRCLSSLYRGLLRVISGIELAETKEIHTSKEIHRTKHRHEPPIQFAHQPLFLLQPLRVWEGRERTHPVDDSFLLKASIALLVSSVSSKIFLFDGGRHG